VHFIDQAIKNAARSGEAAMRVQVCVVRKWPISH
jgi:hypothetical protein